MPSAPTSARSRRTDLPARAAYVLALYLVLVAAACGGSQEPRTFTSARVTVACGRCVFEMPEAKNGCPWAVEIEGKRYLVVGNVPQDHVNHAPDGICNMRRTAMVDGRIEGNRFVATRLVLEPPEDVPEAPKYTPADIH